MNNIQYYCDDCQHLITSDMQRYHCSECEDFDMCAQCASKPGNRIDVSLETLLRQNKKKKIVNNIKSNNNDMVVSGAANEKGGGGAKSSQSFEDEAENQDDDVNDDDDEEQKKREEEDYPRCFQGHKLVAEKGERFAMIEQVQAETGGIGWMIKKLFEVFEHRPMIGVRRKKRTKGFKNPEDEEDCKNIYYHYYTYGEVHNKVAPLAYRIVQLCNKANNAATTTTSSSSSTTLTENVTSTIPRVAIMLENQLDWVVWDFASALSGCILVPIDVNASVDVIHNIIASTEPLAILCSVNREKDLIEKVYALDEEKKQKATTANAAKWDMKRDLVVIIAKRREGNSSSLVSSSSPTYYPTIEDFEEQTHAANTNNTLPALSFLTSPGNRNYPQRKPEDIFAIMPTSGSTGYPKLALASHAAFRNGSLDILDRRDPLVFGIYRPLSYATDRDNIYRSIGNGGRVALLEPPVERWLLRFELGSVVKPVSFSAPPRIFNLLYEIFVEEMKRAEKLDNTEETLPAEEKPKEEKSLDDIDDTDAAQKSNNDTNKSPAWSNDWSDWISTSTTNSNFHRNSNVAVRRARTVNQDAVWRKFREAYFGPRLTALTIGSAPPRPEVLQWMKNCFQLRGNVRVFESYGTTESGGIMTDSRVSFGAQVKLLPVLEGDEEQQAQQQDNNNNNKIRRGEVCVKTEGQISGYWGNVEATNKLFWVDPQTNEKWIRTGDIAELDMRDGTYKLIGRINCVTKLANGTFFSPEPVETSLAKCELIRDLCLHAEPGWDSPVAIVSLNPEKFPNNNNNNNILFENEGSPSSPTTTLKQKILRNLREIGASDQVPASLLPKIVIISPQLFTRENNLLTVSMKLSRPNIKKQFMKEMETEIQKLKDQQQQQQQQKNNNNNENQNDDAANSSNKSASSSPKFMVLQAYDAILHLSKNYENNNNSFSQLMNDTELINTQTAVSLGADSIQVGLLRAKVASTTGVTLPLREFGFMKIVDVIDRATFQCFTGMTQYKSESFNSNNVSEDQQPPPPQNIDPNIIIRQNSNNTNNKNDEEEGMVPKNSNNNNNQGRTMSFDAAELSQGNPKMLNKFKQMLDRDINPDFTPPETSSSSSYLDDFNNRRLKPRSQNLVYLVTGGTGFIGIHLVQKLLSSTISNSNSTKVVLLLRGSGSLQEKFLQSATKFRLPVSFFEEMISTKRLLFVRGDLSSKDSSKIIEKESFEKEVTAQKNIIVSNVIFCGANVNHYLSYPQLSRPNVTSMKHILHFLFDSELEPPQVTFCSSVSVLGLTEKPSQQSSSQNPRTRRDLTSSISHQAQNDNIDHVSLDSLDKEDEINHLLSSSSGYGLSKWAGERLIENCCESLLCHPASTKIVRIGMTSWSTETGAANVSDWLVSLTLAVGIVEKLPNFAPNNSSIPIFSNHQTVSMFENVFWMKLSPVNWMAEKIVGISSLSSSSTSTEKEQQQQKQQVEISLLDNLITVEMVSQVWKRLLEMKQQQQQQKTNENDHDDDSAPPTTIKTVPQWSKFIAELYHKEEALIASKKQSSSSCVTASSSSVAQRCELLFGTNFAPSGDKKEKMKPLSTKEEDGDVLGIDHFCKFIIQQCI